MSNKPVEKVTFLKTASSAGSKWNSILRVRLNDWEFSLLFSEARQSFFFSLDVNI
jgi:hypothetical protein